MAHEPKPPLNTTSGLADTTDVDINPRNETRLMMNDFIDTANLPECGTKFRRVIN
jgi:hypothetical protein